MELRDALRTTGSVREFTDEPVPRSTVLEILEDARFAPSGGNRQGWHVVVVEDPDQRRRIRDAYLDAWHDYVAHLLAGLVAFSPVASGADRAAAAARRTEAESLSRPDGFAENLHRVPVLLAVVVDLAALSAVDRDLERYGFAGGASVYPFVWQILLAARDRDLGGVMTTVGTRNEAELRRILALPEHVAVASLVALGHARRRATRLRRRKVGEFTTLDRFDGPRLGD